MRYLFFLLLVSCNASLTRNSEVPDWFRVEWKLGQDAIAPRAGSSVYSVHPEHFAIESIQGPFSCNDVEANGCFSHGMARTPTIKYNVLTPTVIRHEAQHAILWKLHHPDYACIEHTC